MSHDEIALLRAIKDNPDDDLPRLVYADWLQERAGAVLCEGCYDSEGHGPAGHGNWRRSQCPRCSGTGRLSNGNAERAEFIRVQCELATRHPCDYSRKSIDTCFDRRETIDGVRRTGCHLCKARADAVADLRERERELLDRHWSAWIRGAGLVPDGWKLSTDGDSFHVWLDQPFDDGHRFNFVRGFVGEFVGPWATWLSMAEELTRKAPLTKLTLTDRPTYSRYHNEALRKIQYWLTDSPDAPHLEIDLLTLQWNSWRNIKPAEQLAALAFPGLTVTMPPELPYATVVLQPLLIPNSEELPEER